MRLRRRARSWATAALAVCGAHALPSAAAEPLVLRAEPPSLVLGTGAGATIVIDAPAEGLPRVTANVGRVENLRALGAGRFAVDYRPPESAYPQVAIVAASSGERWGWTSIALWGRGLATARSAPRTEIRVTIGDASFGPVRADAEGEAQVPVIVPSGVEFAYHRDKPLDLKVPPTLHVHLALGVDAAPADVDRELPLRVFAVTPSGEPRAAPPVVVEVTHGEVAALAEVAPGELAGTWRLPRGAATPATASVRLSDEPSLAFAVPLERPAGAPARLVLEADRVRVIAGRELAVGVRVGVEDAAGNPVAEEPRIEATLGVVSAPLATAPGAWEARLDVPADVGPARRTEVIARAADVEDRVVIDIDIAPAPPLVAPSAAPPTLPLAGEHRASAAPKLGLATSRGGLAAAYLGVEAAWRPRLLDGRLALAIEGGGFVRDRTDAVATRSGVFDVRGRVRYVPVIASARLQHALGRRQVIWGAAGAGLAHVASEVSVGSGPVSSESGLVPVLHASAAWGLRAGRATPFGEARLAWHGGPRFDALQGSLTTLTFTIGCRYDAY
jgi:hypothetical protein